LAGSWTRPGPFGALQWRDPMKQFSRRSALFSAAMIPAIAVSRPAQTGAADTVLVALGHRFDALAAQLDHAVEQIEWETLEEISRIETQIVATPATTIEGLCVKARAGCWALLGDLDPDEQSTPTDEWVSQ
jgi:hypothetical protein